MQYIILMCVDFPYYWAIFLWKLTRKLWLSILADTTLGVGLALLVIPVYPDIYGIAK